MKNISQQTTLRILALLSIFSLGLLLFFSQPAEAKPRIASEKIIGANYFGGIRVRF